MTNEQFQKEVLEAIEAANVALKALHQADDDLNSAGNWGLLDMFGGGFFTSLIKQGRMSDAQKHIDEAKRALVRFSKELQDVNMSLNLGLNNGGFLDFADVFMDNFFVDFMVQNQINDAQKQVKQAIRRVEEIRDQLSRM